MLRQPGFEGPKSQKRREAPRVESDISNSFPFEAFADLEAEGEADGLSSVLGRFIELGQQTLAFRACQGRRALVNSLGFELEPWRAAPYE